METEGRAKSKQHWVVKLREKILARGCMGWETVVEDIWKVFERVSGLGNMW